MKDLPPMSPDPSASELGSERYRISGRTILYTGFFMGIGLGLFIPTPFHLDPLAAGALIACSGLVGLLAAMPLALWLDPPESSSAGQKGILLEIFRKTMTKRPQFSLAYLFLETFWIALALGLATQAFRLRDEAADRFSLTLMLFSIQAGGAAIGGLFHQMKTGFFAASAMIIGFIVLIFLLMTGEVLLR
jgi:Na+/proline symporter